MFGGKRKILFEVEICVEKDGEEFHAYCPALKGIHIDGRTEGEALENAKIATRLYISSLIKHGDPIPIHMVVTAESQERSCQGESIICPPQQKHTENIHVTI